MLCFFLYFLWLNQVHQGFFIIGFSMGCIQPPNSETLEYDLNFWWMKFPPNLGVFSPTWKKGKETTKKKNAGWKDGKENGNSTLPGIFQRLSLDLVFCWCIFFTDSIPWDSSPSKPPFGMFFFLSTLEANLRSLELFFPVTSMTASCGFFFSNRNPPTYGP